MTNRQSTSRDVASMFSEQYMFRHIMNGGSYLVCIMKNKVYRGEPDVDVLNMNYFDRYTNPLS